jgi:hypothetical protein
VWIEFVCFRIWIFGWVLSTWKRTLDYHKTHIISRLAQRQNNWLKECLLSMKLVNQDYAKEKYCYKSIKEFCTHTQISLGKSSQGE